MTSKERKRIKEITEYKETSMNQFILDSIFDSEKNSTDNIDDIALIEVLQQQI